MRTQRMQWQRGTGRTAALLLLALVAACSGEGPTGPGNGGGNPQPGQPGPKPVAAVVVSPDTVLLQLSSTRMLSATLEAADRTPLADRTVEWSSSDSSVARVTSNGIVVAQAPGTATITATSEGKQGHARVEVAPPPPPPSVAYVRLTPGEVTLSNDPATWQLTARTWAADGRELAGREVAWTSSDTTRVKVYGGRLLAYGAGTAYVTATSEGKSAQAKVVVPEWQRALQLKGAAGLQLPALFDQGGYVDERGVAHTVRRVVTDGAIRLGFVSDRYEQRLTVQTYEDGVLVGTRPYSDRGTVGYDMFTGDIVFNSTLYSGLRFTAAPRADGGLAVTQRIGGEGAPATFVFGKS